MLKRMLVLVGVLMLLLCACKNNGKPNGSSKSPDGEEVAGRIDQSEIEASVNDTAKTPTDSDMLEQTYPLTLTAIGENKLLVTLTDEHTDGFLEIDETSTFQDTFRVYFFAENEQKLSITMTPYSWDVSGVGIASQGGAPDFYVNGQKDTYQVTDNTISFEVNQTGITEHLSQCDNYTLYYHDKNNQQEMLASGSLTDVVSIQETTETITITYMDDDQAIVRLAGQTFDRYLAGEEYHDLVLKFYLPGNDSYTPLYELRVSSGVDLFSSKLYQLTLQQGAGILDSQELIGDRYNNAVRTESEYSVQIFYNGIESLLSACDRIVVTDDEGEILLTESYVKAAMSGKVTIPDIPEVFEANAKDGEYFYPVTEDYIVIMLDMPMSTVLDYGYGSPDGIEYYYAPIESHEAPLKIISVISYNEFGISDQRTKIIYDSIASAMSAAADRLDWYPVSQLTGEEAKDNDILADFMESLDQKVFGSSANGNGDYQYFGHYDNVRYFDASIEQIKFLYSFPPSLSYDLSAAFGPDGFMTEAVQYSYDFPDYSLNRSVMREGMATVTVYSSKQ